MTDAGHVEDERQRRLDATQLLCIHLVAIAQMRGAGTATRYTPELVPRRLRAVTREVIDDARVAIEQIEQTWKDRDLR